MLATTMGVGTLRQLSGLATDGHPVLSLYVDLDASRFPTPAARDAEVSALLSHAGRTAQTLGVCAICFGRDRSLLEVPAGLRSSLRPTPACSRLSRCPGNLDTLAVVDTVCATRPNGCCARIGGARSTISWSLPQASCGRWSRRALTAICATASPVGSRSMSSAHPPRRSLASSPPSSSALSATASARSSPASRTLWAAAAPRQPAWTTCWRCSSRSASRRFWWPMERG